MRPHAFDFISVDSQGHGAPTRILLSNKPFRPYSVSTLMAAGAAMIVIPQIVLAVTALLDSDVRQALASHPLAAVQAAIALLCWTAIILVPVFGLTSRIGRRRSIEIQGGSVSVEDASLFGKRQWRAPLSEFCGIAHHIRTTHSDLRHEAILVHPQRSKCLLLQSKETLSDAEIASWNHRIGLPLVPPSAVYFPSRPATGGRYMPDAGTAPRVVAAAA